MSDNGNAATADAEIAVDRPSHDTNGNCTTRGVALLALQDVFAAATGAVGDRGRCRITIGDGAAAAEPEDE